jgi:hypothetical protein
MTHQIGGNRMLKIDGIVHVVGLVQYAFYRPHETTTLCDIVVTGGSWSKTRKLRPVRVTCMTCIVKGAT